MYYKPRALLVGSNPGVISRGKENDADEKVIDVNVTLWSYSINIDCPLTILVTFAGSNPGVIEKKRS